MTFREASRWAASTLSDIPSPRRTAEILICHAMDWMLHELYLNHSEPVPARKLEMIRRLVEARADRIPLQHLTGMVEFMGRSFSSGPGALIPRPETEILLDAFLGILPPEPCALLDAGTGSGVLGICLSLEFPSALVIGSDLSMQALAVAGENVTRHGPEGLKLVQADLLSPFTSLNIPFDGIVANLPYVRTNEIGLLEPEVRDGDPVMALDGGANGLDLVRRLLEEAPGLLRPGGALALELDPSQTGTVRDMLDSSGEWRDVEVIRDLTGLERVIRTVKSQGRR